MQFGNFAENLAGRSPGSLIAKLGRVVAPTLDDDEYEDDEYETDSGSSSYYEEEEEYEIDDADSREESEDLEEEFVFENHGVDGMSNNHEHIDGKDPSNHDELGDHIDVSRQTIEKNKNLDEKLLVQNEAEKSDVEGRLFANDNGIENETNGNLNAQGLKVGTDSLQNDETNKETVQIDSSEHSEEVPSSISNRYVQSLGDGALQENTVTRQDVSTNDDEPQKNNYEIDSTQTHILSIQENDQGTTSTTNTKRENQLKRLLQEANDRANKLEKELQSTRSNQKNESIAQNQQQLRALYLSDQKATDATKKLEDANQKIKSLEKNLNQMNMLFEKTKQSLQRKEEVLKEIKEENEALEEHVHEVQEENETLEEKIQSLEDEKIRLQGLQMELHLLKEARDRDRIQIQSTAESTSSNINKICVERDEARSEARSAQQQLEGTQADLGILKSDLERLTMSNENLQRALQAFQTERDAELELLEQQRKDADLVQSAANDAKLVALKEENQARMREVQLAADMAVKNSMKEIEHLEGTVEKFRKENTGLRSSLDEAIQRLQLSQEDVIDRTLMKNILLDWHNKRGHSKKQVLELMANVLHFTEEEKTKVYIGEGNGASGALGKVMGAVAAPLPPAVLNVDKLEGDNVREKWVNFLLAETGEIHAEENGTTEN